MKSGGHGLEQHVLDEVFKVLEMAALAIAEGGAAHAAVGRRPGLARGRARPPAPCSATLG
jgi:hypothetical protein